MRSVGDLRLLDHPGSALERVRQPQQPRDHRIASPALFELEDALRELVQKIARLEPKIFIGISRHALCRQMRPNDPQKIL